MSKLLLILIKKIILSVFMLYGLNLLISSLNIVIPINVITISLVSLLGIPSICVFVVLFLVL